MVGIAHPSKAVHLIDRSIDLDLLLKKLYHEIPVKITTGSAEHHALILASEVVVAELIALFRLSHAVRKTKAQSKDHLLKPQSVRANNMRARRYKARDDKILRYLIARGVNVREVLKLTQKELIELKLKEV